MLCVAIATASERVSVLFVVLESLAFDMLVVKLTVVPQAAGSGLIGIEKVSVPSAAIDHDLVQVTVVPTVALHDQPLSVKAAVGPVKFAGTVNVFVVVPFDDAFPTLVMTIGRREV